MKKIEKLPDDLTKRLPSIAKEWISHGLSCEPADRQIAEAGVMEAYAAASLKPPKIVIWMDGPSHGAMAAAFLSNSSKYGAQVWAQVWDQVRDQVRAQVWDQVGAQVGAQVWDQVRDQVRDQVWAQVRAQVWDQVGDQVRDQVDRCGYGQHDAGWLSFYSVFAGLVPSVDRFGGLLKIAQSSGWWWPFANAVILTERPMCVHRDHLNRLHRMDGPAVAYRDETKVYAWKGLRVPAELVEQRSAMTPQQIAAISNAEHRRVAIEIYAAMHGPARFAEDLGAKLVKSDTVHGHPRRLYALGDARFVHVVNGSLEPDGTRREFLLGAPPSAKTPKAAIAASFGRPADKYREAVRT